MESALPRSGSPAQQTPLLLYPPSPAVPEYTILTPTAPAIPNQLQRVSSEGRSLTAADSRQLVEGLGFSAVVWTDHHHGG